MRNLRILLVAGAAAVALAFGVSALAKTAPQPHEMTVALPDGAVAHIQYTGEKPVVAISPGVFTERWLSDWRPWEPSTLLVPDISQIAASIDQHMAAMRADMERLDPTAAEPGLATNVSGTSSTRSFCARSVEVTQTGNSAPRIQERTYGNCGETNGHTGGAPSGARPATRT